LHLSNSFPYIPIFSDREVTHFFLREVMLDQFAVGRTANPLTAPIQQMGLDHGCDGVFVPQQILYNPDFISIFE